MFSTRKTAIRSVLLVAVLLTATASTAAFGAAFPWPLATQQGVGMDAYSVTPGIVVDPGAGFMFSMAPDDLLEAVDLADGRVLWQTRDAAKPLLVFGDLLLAQAPTAPGHRSLEIRVLRKTDGKLLHSVATSMPKDVRPSIDEGLGRIFELQAEVAGSVFVINWSYDERKITGASPDLVPDAGRKQMSGQFRLDPQVGELTPSDESFRWLKTRPDLAAGERIAGIEGTQFRAGNADSLMVSRAVADARVWDRYEWRVVSRTNGADQGSIQAPVSYAPYFVNGATLVYVSNAHQRRLGDELVSHGRRLLAHDLSTGQEAWSRELRDPAYRGPFPP